MQHPPGYPPPGPWQPQRPYQAPAPGYWPSPQGYGPPPQPPRPGLSAAVIVLIVIVGTMALGGAGCLMCVCAARGGAQSSREPQPTFERSSADDVEAMRVFREQLGCPRHCSDSVARVVSIEVTRQTWPGKPMQRTAVVKTTLYWKESNKETAGHICGMIVNAGLPAMETVVVKSSDGVAELARCRRFVPP